MARLYVLDYPFTMKYVLILAAVVILVRIDMVMKIFDRTRDKLRPSAESVMDNSTPAAEIVSFKSDPSLKPSAKRIFLSFLRDFKNDPSEPSKARVLEHLRTSPEIFNGNADKELAGAIEALKDMLRQRSKVTALLLIDLIPLLKGDNAEAAQGALATYMDYDLPEFLLLYQRTTDSNCSIASVQSDQIPEREKYYELSERLVSINNYLASEKSNPLLRSLAQNCQLVLKLHLDKLRPSYTDTEEETPLESTTEGSEIDSSASEVESP